MRSFLLPVALALVLAGCASSPAPSPPSSSTPSPSVSSTPAAPEADVHVKALAFSPASYPEEAGGTVSWINDDSVPHTVTADDDSFDSGILQPGQRYEHAFNASGTVGYHCKIHASMKGAIVVGGGSPSPTPTSPTSPTPAAGNGTAVTIMDFSFTPATLTVPAGTTVTWTNGGERTHTVTADDGSFDSGAIASGSTFQHAFATPGTYGYHCAIHGSMKATIVVT